jgi:hypothetical protein
MSMSLMRKYSKPLMAVFGVVLMITFLLGYAYTSGVGSGTPTMIIGHLGSKPVTNTELVPYQIDVHVLRIMAQNDSQFAQEYMNWESNSSHSDLPLKFFLLVKEAQQYGLMPDNEFPADMQGTKAFERAIASVTANSNFAVQNVAQALGDLSMVDRMYQLATQTATPSRPQVLHYVTRITTSLQVQYVKLTAREWLKHHHVQPSPALMQMLYHRYKSVLPWNPNRTAKPPNIASARFPFGFRYPDRVKLEYLKFNAAAVARTMHPDLADVSAAYAYYQAHKSDFEITPAKTVKGKKTPARYEPFKAVKAHLVQEQIEKKIQAMFARMASMANHLANRPWKAFDASGYRKRVAPADWVQYGVIADKLAARFGYKPDVGRISQWATESEIAAHRDLGNALTAPGALPQSEGIAYLALRVRALDPHSKGDGLLLHLQVGRQGPILTNRTTGDVYVYRVTAVSPAHDPTNINQVKAKVLRASQLYMAFKTLERQSAKLAAVAPAESLKKAAAANGLRIANSGVFHPLTLEALYPGIPQSPRIAMPSRIKGVPFVSRKLVDSAFNLAYEAHLHGAKTVSYASLTKSEIAALASGALTGPHHPAATVALHRYLTLIVMQLCGYDALPANALKSPYLLSGATQSMLNDPSQQAYVPWFNFKQIAARMDYHAAH